jgi:hypothetical protein
VTGDPGEIALVLAPGDSLRDHALVDLDGVYTGVLATAARGALRIPLGMQATEVTVAGSGSPIATSLGTVTWLSARGAVSLFGGDTSQDTALCRSFAGCTRTAHMMPTVGALGGSTPFVALRDASLWSFLTPGTGEFAAESGNRLRSTAGEAVVERAVGGFGSRLFVGDSMGVSAVDIGPCSRGAVSEDGTVVLAHAPDCTLADVRIEETSCTPAGCACGASCTGGEIEAEFDLSSLELPNQSLIDWELEVADDVRIVAMLVGDTSASSTGTDVLVAMWNAADGATAPRVVVPVLVTSGRLGTTRGVGRDVDLVVRRTATSLDVVVGVAVRAGGTDVLAAGGLTLCGE